jgi:hypothetical protein
MYDDVNGIDGKLKSLAVSHGWSGGTFHNVTNNTIQKFYVHMAYLEREMAIRVLMRSVDGGTDIALLPTWGLPAYTCTCGTN